MTADQKALIIRKRDAGRSFVGIADELGVSVNTIKSYYRRNKLGKPKPIADGTPLLCKQCGRILRQRPKRKPKIFCSDHCRIRWWNDHRDDVASTAAVKVVCATCGKSFQAYPHDGRKYCSHACYITQRFGGEMSDDT